MISAVAVSVRERRGLVELLRGVAWGVLPLVASLFVIVAALEQTGLATTLAITLSGWAQQSATRAAAWAGVLVAIGCNIVNNLPAGLLAGRVLQQGNLPQTVQAAVLIGVDLGPNLSLTGSLATLLWLAALRREGVTVGAVQFLRLGIIVMTPAVVLSIAAVLVMD